MACDRLTCHKAGREKPQANARQPHAVPPTLQSHSHSSRAAIGPGHRGRRPSPHVSPFEPCGQLLLRPTDPLPWDSTTFATRWGCTRVPCRRSRGPPRRARTPSPTPTGRWPKNSSGRCWSICSSSTVCSLGALQIHSEKPRNPAVASHSDIVAWPRSCVLGLATPL